MHSALIPWNETHFKGLGRSCDARGNAIDVRHSIGSRRQKVKLVQEASKENVEL